MQVIVEIHGERTRQRLAEVVHGLGGRMLSTSERRPHRDSLKALHGGDAVEKSNNPSQPDLNWHRGGRPR